MTIFEKQVIEYELVKRILIVKSNLKALLSLDQFFPFASIKVHV